MDKKNTMIGVLLLLAAFASLYFGNKLSPPAPHAPSIPAPIAPAPTGQEPAPPPLSQPPPVSPSDATFAAIAKENDQAKVVTLANDFIRVSLTDFGGAIDDVAFLKYAAMYGKPQPYVFNQPHVDPILGITGNPVKGLGPDTLYRLVSKTATEAVYQAVVDGTLEVTRRYSIQPAGTAKDPYVIRQQTTFRNLTDKPLTLQPVGLSLGTTALVSTHDFGFYLNVATFNGKSTDVTTTGDLEGAGFIGRLFGKSTVPRPYIASPGPVVWASVKNQFFASIYNADKPGSDVITRRVDLAPLPGSQRPNIGLSGTEQFQLSSLAPGGKVTLGGALYVGPKEYQRLARLPHDQDLVMQYSRGFEKIFLSGYVAPLMNTLMNWTHDWVRNWGLAIVLMTLILKTVTLPFTLAASRSAKRMQKFQPEIKALREKFKDNPQKLNQATLELFKKHKINPMGGCLPILITMPLFFGFYSMLLGSAELRFQGFLWARDLSAPDTIFHLFSFPVNPMPILMAVTMFVQMRLTPQPTVDNAQAKMMKFMPLLFTFFCYGYSCALSLYMTINGLFTIGQQLVINRMKDPATDAVPATAGASGGRLKNVTPAKKKGRT